MYAITAHKNVKKTNEKKIENVYPFANVKCIKKCSHKFIGCVGHNLYFFRSRSEETLFVVQTYSFDLAKSAKPLIYILYK